MKKYLALPLAVLLPLTSVTKCDPSETAPDHSITCRQPKGYVKAGLAAKAGKGTFYLCIKNSKPCIVKYELGGRKKTISMYHSGLLNIPKAAKGWTNKNCGKIYKKKA